MPIQVNKMRLRYKHKTHRIAMGFCVYLSVQSRETLRNGGFNLYKLLFNYKKTTQTVA